MRRFNFDDDERKDVDGFLGDGEEGEELTPEEYEAIVGHHAFIAQMQLEAVHKDLSLKLLSRAIRMLEKGFFWGFYSEETQLKKIAKVYRLFEKLTFGEKEE